MERKEHIKLHEYIYASIADALDRVTVLPPIRALGRKGSMIPSEYKNNCLAWSYIFKRDNWLETVMQLQTGSASGEPIPTLLGKDLIRICRGDTQRAHIAIMVNDWSGECLFLLQKLFFECLHEHERLTKSIIYLKDSGIYLHFDEILRGQEEILVSEPKNLIGFEKGGGPFTYLAYYNEGKLRKAGPDSIVGTSERK
ncbi:hypothetical protein B0J13DRAFT_662136 [Dactylonectria estremocensis]|uniref:Uncharacterized protein n=1 Tax=Dactylonectria estremocensis TaxID=1079267 RepID=A0A9P9D0H5_9HYPO|nr:hypothetical protein B0J13DRAFT_662136 [Dactylonectria estremocensis]